MIMKGKKQTEEYVALKEDPLAKITKRYENLRDVYGLMGIVLPLMTGITAAIFPDFYKNLHLHVAIFACVLLVLLFVILYVAMRSASVKMNSFQEKRIYSNANSRNIDKLVDQYTALIGAVADAINDRNANRDSVYGIITERMSEEISARISSSGTVSVCFYRKSNNKARLVWHNEIINRTLRKKITYTSDEMTHENHSNSYVHEKIFSRTDDITLLYQRDIFKKFPKIDKTLKKE